MTDKPACPECGASVPPDAPRGLCPRCLMGAAFSATGTYRPRPAPEPGAPAPAPVDPAEFRRVALELGLVAPADLDRLAAEAGDDVPRLARLLSRSGKLTPYQAGALAQGKGKGLAIGSYLVLERRGQGGMGVVFRARHRESGQVVALKILLPSFGRDREAVLRFRREFEVAARLKHPNVVGSLEAAEDRGVQFLTMEYVEGHDLDDLVREVGPLPIKMSLHCAIQAARGLAAAHAGGIVHRDVKPGNLMLDPTGAVRVLDLGLARIVEASSALGRVAGSSLTQSGSYMGTVDFIAPEQANDSKKADHRADIYSLGCTLHFLLAGRPPFEGETILKRLMAHQQRPAPSLHAARHDVPAALEATYQTMMAKRPEDRPRSMAEVIDLLENCRTTADEAKQARAGLRSFAETVMKRASPRVRDRNPDASVFARRTGKAGPEVDHGLSLADLALDYRDEIHAAPLAEDQPPPMMPRLAAPRKRARRPVPWRLLGAVAAAILLVVALKQVTWSWPKTAPKVVQRPPVLVSARADGFVPLFNGRDLAGWKTHPGQPGRWRVEGGVLTGSGRDSSHLYTDRGDYADFHLRVEARINDRGNGGVLFRSTFGPVPSENPSTSPDGYEAQINSTHWNKDRTGGIRISSNGPGRPKGSLAVAVDEGPPPGRWFTLEMIARGPRIVIRLDGKTTADFTDQDRLFAAGHIALQSWVAARPAEPETVAEFRKVEIRELSPGDDDGLPPVAGGFVPLFNKVDLSGWAGDLDGYEVRGEILRSKAGRTSTIYVPRTYRDFAARVEFRLTPGGNGGLAIRYPGSGDPAYAGMCEIQILDDTAPQYAAIDPRQAHGSAFGLAPAIRGHLRPVGQWNTQEVTVRGSMVKVELNGTVILDTDLSRVAAFLKNQPHPGKYRDTGFFGLAGQPEPVEYRKVEIREIPRGEPSTPAPAQVATTSPFDKLVTVDFQGASLREVMETFDKALVGPNAPTGLPFFLDPAGLQQAGQSFNSRITYSAKEVPLKVALGSALATIGMGYFLDNALITITSRPIAQAANKLEYPAPLLFTDHFNREGGYWVPTTPAELAKDPNHFWGYSKGRYFEEARIGGMNYVSKVPNGPFPPFSLELHGRVTGDQPTSTGSMLLQVIRKDRGFQVNVDGTGALSVEPRGFNGQKPPDGPRLGPIYHPAIHPGGGELNTVQLLVTRRRVEILVNEVRVCEPITYDFDLTPAQVWIGVHSQVPTVRAEYNSIELLELPPAADLANLPPRPGQPPADAKQFLGKSYQVYPRKLTWHQAEAACREMGGHLATPSNDRENAFLADLAASRGLDSAWLGATDEKQEGTWVRVDGGPLGYSRWGTGQPNNKFNAEHYAILMVTGVAGRGSWSDQPDTPLPASGNYGFACQWD